MGTGGEPLPAPRGEGGFYEDTEITGILSPTWWQSGPRGAVYGAEPMPQLEAQLEAQLSHLCLGSVKACPPSFRHFGPGDKRSGGWGGRDREWEVTADKSCWADTPLPDSWRRVLPFSQQLPPVGTWAPLPHPLGLRCHPYGESQTHPMSPDPRSVLPLLPLVW